MRIGHQEMELLHLIIWNQIQRILLLLHFFIGWSDRLGSGVRNIFKYSKYYSGKEPEFIEGDVFRLIVPLNEDYSYDNVKNGDKKTAIKKWR